MANSLSISIKHQETVKGGGDRNIKDWSAKCDKIRRLDFNPQREVSSRLRSVGPFPPSSKETTKKEQPDFYNLLVRYEIIKVLIISCELYVVFAIVQLVLTIFSHFVKYSEIF